jgi:hypothetical protein
VFQVAFITSQALGQGGGIVLSGLGDSISMSNIDVTAPAGVPTTPTATVLIGFDLMGMPVTPQQGTAGEAVENLVNNLVVFTGTPPNLTKWNDLQGEEMMLPVHITLNAPKTVRFYSLTSANDAPDRDPHRWRLLGSTLANPTSVNDFTLLDERDGVEYSDRHQTQLFGPVTNTTAYLTYRFEFETQWFAHMTGGMPNSIQLAEVELFENFAGGGLKMEINRGANNADSTMTLISAATTPLQILGYSITSPGGTLNSGNWNSIADHSDGDSGGTMDTDKWIRLTEPDGRNDLSEVEEPNGTAGITLSPAGTFNLGNNVWIKQPTEDVTAEVLLLVDGQPQTQQVSVTFTGQPSYRFGDLNLDRNATITFQDWIAFKNGQNFDFSTVHSAAESYIRGDLDGDFDHDLADYGIFKTTFDNANGAGAFQAMLAAVPEPTTATLLAAAIWLTACRSVRRRGLLVVLVLITFACLGVEAAHAQVILPGLVGNDLTNPDNMGPPDVTVTAGGQAGSPATEMPLMAVDSDVNTKWLAFLPNGTFYQLQFNGGGRSAVNRYTITSANDAPERDPYSWTLSGSNDGINYTVLDTRMTQDFAARMETHDHTFTNTTRYHLYRFDFQTPFGAGVPVDPTNPQPNSIQLAEIELFGSAVVPVQLTLEVNAATGSIRIANNTTDPITLDAYEIRSAAGSLNVNNWWGAGAQGAKNGGQSIHDQTIAGFPSGNGTGNGWEEGPGSSNNEITEWFLGAAPQAGQGSSTLAGGASITMNGVFQVGGTRDLTFDYRTVGAVFRGEVQYIGGPAPVTGDYNGNGIVDAADYVLWRNGGPLQNEGATPGTTTPEDYSVWRANFGRSGAGAALGSGSAVPEPAGWILALVMSVLCGVSRWRRVAPARVIHHEVELQPIRRRNAMSNQFPRGLGLLGMAALGLLLAASAYGSTLDRDYKLGNDPQENAVAGQVVGQNSALANHTLDSAPPFTFQDLMQHSGPTYVNTQALSRPGAAAGALGVQFNGASSQYLSGNGLGSPREGGNLYGRNNYANDRLMQVWVRPTLNNSQRQEIISDTFQFGIFISDTGMWGHTYGSDVAPPELGDDFVTNNPVAFNQWTHVMQRTFDNDSVALYINGVAVSRFNADYEEVTGGTGDLNMYVGANSGATGNFFSGQLDDIKLHVAGVFTPQDNPIPVNWGAVNLGTENDFIVSRNLVNGDVNGDGVVNGNGSGPVATDDVSFFIDHWLDQRTVNGFVMGDRRAAPPWAT